MTLYLMNNGFYHYCCNPGASSRYPMLSCVYQKEKNNLICPWNACGVRIPFYVLAGENLNILPGGYCILGKDFYIRIDYLETYKPACIIL